jgi:hypothetical protein
VIAKLWVRAVTPLVDPALSLVGGGLGLRGALGIGHKDSRPSRCLDGVNDKDVKMLSGRWSWPRALGYGGRHDSAVAWLN